MSNFKSIFSILLVSVFIFGISYDRGVLHSKKHSSIIKINSSSKLSKIRNCLSCSYKLTSDIKIKGKWKPIGSKAKPFTGRLDGNHKTISNIYIEKKSENSLGLFSYIGENARVKNLTIKKAKVVGKYYLGALVGTNNKGIIENVKVEDVKLKGKSDIGGLAGRNLGKISNSSSMRVEAKGRRFTSSFVGVNMGGTVDNCYGRGEIKGEEFIGGFAGSNVRKGTIKNSYSEAKVEGDSSGGLVGYNDAIIENSYSLGETKGEETIGGLVGWNLQGTVEGSYSLGTVVGDSRVGGLSGVNGNSIINSYSAAIVEGDRKVGGLVGENWNGSIEKSYSVSSTKGNTDTGGLVGWNNDGVVEDSYFSIDKTGQDRGVGTGSGKEGVIAYNTEDISDEGSFSSWDFAGVWKWLASRKWPHLSWQK